MAAEAAAAPRPAPALPHLQVRDVLLQVAHHVLVLVLRRAQLHLVALQHLLQPPAQLHHGSVPAAQQRRLQGRQAGGTGA
jgi:hypothetical protein